MIIGDSSALIALAVIDKLDLLEKLFNKLYIPQAVYDELIMIEKPYGIELNIFLKNKIKQVRKIQYTSNLGKGELEAISLYHQIQSDFLLIDDMKAKKFAINTGAKAIGSLGVLIIAKQKGLIKEVKPLVEKLENSQIYISKKLIKKVLLLCDET